MPRSFLARITPIDLGAHVGGGPVYPEPPVDPGYGIPEGGHIDNSLPLPPAPGFKPEHPIVLPPPGAPSHPIYIPSPIPPEEGHPSHPIVLPPPKPDAPLEPVVGWTQFTGWVVVFVPTDEAVLPTPSAGGLGKK